MNRYIYAIVKRIRGLITIDSINNGLPLTYEGLFEDGMYYFADTTGTKVVDQNDPDRSEWFIGTGNADGDIDLDIKMLAITDVVVPETVQLGVAFDVSGNYVMLEDKIVIEGYNGSTWVKLHVGDYIEVADGSFTESVTLQSADGFTVNTTITVRVRSYDGYALNGSDSTDVIATVTMNAISGMVDGTPYTLEGGTDGDAVEIWVDDGTGYVYEGDAVVVGSAWTYDITLSAGTYGVKAIDGTDGRGYAEQTGVVVASGLFAFQFGGTGDDKILKVEKVGTDYYVAGATKSAQLFGENTGYSSGWRLFLCKLNSTGTKQWILFGDADSDVARANTMCYDAVNSKIYWVSDNYTGVITNNNKIKRVTTSGSIEAIDTYNHAFSSNSMEGVCTDGNKIYVATHTAYTTAILYVLNYNFSTGTGNGTKITIGAISNKNILNDVHQDSTHVYASESSWNSGWTPDGGRIIKYRKSNSYIEYSTSHNKNYRKCAISGNRILVFTDDGTNYEVRMIQKSDLATLYTQDIDTVLTDATDPIAFNGSKFVFGRRPADKSKAIIYIVNDDDTYGATTKDIIQNSGTMEKEIIVTQTLGLFAGCVDGKLLSGSTDAGGTDGFIYDEG